MHDKSYMQITVLSGKGGTGKTTLTASFAKLIQNKVVIDCDVDAANLYLLLNPEIIMEKEYYGGRKAEIDLLKCTDCGLCENLCRFQAIKELKVDPISCEGCGLCVRACPENAISFELNKSGVYFRGKLEDNSEFYYAKLFPGEGNSGKLVSEIKKEATGFITEETEWILVDGPPGIECPVNASLAGTDYVVLVAEPTLAGLHDLKRLIELLNTFKYRYGIIVNKYDLNEDITKEIIDITEKTGTALLGLMPFHEDFVHSLQQGKTIVEYNPEIKKLIENVWSEIIVQTKSRIN